MNPIPTGKVLRLLLRYTSLEKGMSNSTLQETVDSQ